MKVKYLFGSLLGGILLAACTADDALDSGLTASKANPSAPVFTVSLGDNGSDTRAFMGGTTGFTLNFEKGDLLSLYHGGTEDLESYGNAIYKAEDKSADDPALTFMTQAMVKQGYALMVWPADTTFKNDGTSAPVLSIDLEQKYNPAYNVQGGKLGEDGNEIDDYLEAITWLKTPYISEILDIAKYGNYNDEENELNKTNTAGYGRKYDIKLKRVGSTMKLDMKRLNEPDLSEVTRADGELVTPLTFDKVTLSVEGGATPFTYEIPVTVGTGTPHSQDEETKAIWAKVSEVDVITAKGKSAVSTEHITSPAYTGKDCVSSAYFTLLPTDVGASSNYNSATATIETYYGNVAVTGTKEGYYDPYVTGGGLLSNESELKWHKDCGIESGYSTHKRHYSVRSGLAEFLTGMYSNASTGTFKDEKVGHAGTRYLDVDMSTVKMDGLHIKDEIQLMDVMAVYRDLAKDQFGDGKYITLYLDGGTKHPSHKDLEENAEKEFKMSKATWQQVVDEMQEGNLKFVPCGGVRSSASRAEECLYIRLENKEAAEEVPELIFGQATNGDDNAVVVRLDGNWEYTSSTDKDSPKELTGVKTLEVVKDAKLELQNYVLAVDKRTSNSDEHLLIDVKEGGELFTETYNTRVGVDVVNSGTINITRLEEQPETQVTSFRMDNEKTLTNLAGTNVVYTDEADGVVNGVVKHLTEGSVKYGGVINDGSRLGIVDNSGANIYNYGTINLTTHDARLYVTKNVNATSGNTLDAFKKGHSATNQIGTIVLFDKEAGEDNVKIGEKDLRGFIKLYITDGAATADLYGEVANYIVLESGVTSYEDKDGIAFVELSQNNKREVRFGNAALRGLIVNPGAAANIQKNTTVTVATGAYVKGSIWRASKLDIPQFDVYFGGSDADRKNVTNANE